MKRREFTFALGASALLAPTGALALNEAGAERLIGKLVGDINNVIASGKSEKAMYRDFGRFRARSKPMWPANTAAGSASSLAGGSK